MNMINRLLYKAVQAGASDLHLTVGLPPCIRVNGRLHTMNDEPIMAACHTLAIAEQVLTKEQKERFEDKGEMDLSYGIRELGRFRVNVYRQRNSVAIAIRVIPPQVIPLDQLGLPSVVRELCSKKDGLILVTGPAGSGKSTTLAAMIDEINHQRRDVVLTLEDPIEFLHTHGRCVINQREVGSDTRSFAEGLRSALRSDPDVILVGEMRDAETMAIAVQAAETGHLVLSTLHTRSSAQTIDRIVDAFPPHGQQQIRVQLASSIEAVISQRLLPRRDGQGRVLATEVMIGTPAVRNLIREGKTHQLEGIIETSARFGMHTMRSDLKNLLDRGVIAPEEIIELGERLDA